MAQTIRPLNDRILVKRVEAEQQTAGGIIIPDSAKEKPTEAKVLAVGNGKILDNGTVIPLSIKADDRILIGKWSGTEVELGREEFLLVKEDEILAVLEA